MWTGAIEYQGFAIVRDVLGCDDVSDLSEEVGRSAFPRSRAGVRHVLRDPVVANVGRDPRLVSIARDMLGASAIPFRATFFDKSPESNWLVAWHQDTALPLRERREKEGWGPWSMKQGVDYAHAPASALSKVVALRVHLDDSAADNGPLRVLPGTHQGGVLTGHEIRGLADRVSPVDCLVGKGGVIAIKPLIVHSSSKSRVADARRVLHIEYIHSLDLGGGLTLAIV